MEFRKVYTTILVFVLAILSLAYSLNIETGYLYVDSKLSNIGSTTQAFNMLPLRFSKDTKFDGTFYVKTGLTLNNTYDNLYVHFSGDFYGFSLPVPVTVPIINEAYTYVCTDFGDFKGGRFVEKLPDSEVFNVYDKVGSKIDTQKLPITGGMYTYTSDFGTLKVIVYSALEGIPTSPEATFTVKTNLPENVKAQIIKNLSSSSSNIVLEDQKLIDHFNLGVNWMGNLSNIDYYVLLGLKKADYMMIDKITSEGANVKKPYIFTLSNGLVYQIPSKPFIIHNYLSYESDSVSNFNVYVPSLSQNVEIEEKVPDSLNEVIGVEYQLGSNGIIGFDTYVNLKDFKYNDTVFGLYGSYKKDKLNLKYVVKYNLESKVFDILYEASYNFDKNAGIFIRGIKNSDDNLIMLGVESRT